MLIADNWGFAKIIRVLTSQNKTQASLCYPIKKKKNLVIFQGLKTNTLEKFPNASAGLLFDSSFQAHRRETAGFLVSWARSSVQPKKYDCKAVPLFSWGSLGIPKLESPCSWTPLLEFHTSFSIKQLFAYRTGPPSMSYKACLWTDVWTCVWCH